jgi:hypothetical protein
VEESLCSHTSLGTGVGRQILLKFVKRDREHELVSKPRNHPNFREHEISGWLPFVLVECIEVRVVPCRPRAAIPRILRGYCFFHIINVDD